MSTIDLNDYVTAGYFITKYATDGFWKSPLMPERVISLSGCIGQSLALHWGWDVEKHRQEMLDFGIPPEKFPAFQQWTMGDTVDHPNVIKTLDAARHFIAQFLPIRESVVLVCAAMPKDMVDDLLANHKQEMFDVKALAYRETLFGVNRILTDRKPLEVGGDVLGFEVISYFMGSLGHSWLCSDLQKDMNELFGIRPNQYGLIDTYQEAQKVYEWIAEDDMKGHRAEPEPYYPWLLVRYPLDSSAV
jgi:hypothetical protein